MHIRRSQATWCSNNVRVFQQPANKNPPPPRLFGLLVGDESTPPQIGQGSGTPERESTPPQIGQGSGTPERESTPPQIGQGSGTPERESTPPQIGQGSGTPERESTPPKGGDTKVFPVRSSLKGYPSKAPSRFEKRSNSQLRSALKAVESKILADRKSPKPRKKYMEQLEQRRADLCAELLRRSSPLPENPQARTGTEPPAKPGHHAGALWAAVEESLAQSKEQVAC
jgi:hypothetical protein